MEDQKKLSEENEEVLISIVEEINTKTLSEIATEFFERQGIVISLSSIHRILLKHQITRKRNQIVPIERNLQITIDKRFDYACKFCTEYQNIDESRFVYLDESGFNLHLKRTYGRSPRGTPSSVLVPASPGANLSLVQAITNTRVVYFEIYRGGVKAENFKDFLQNLLERLPENPILIFDNARVHHARIVKAFLEENLLEYEFLPPYSPFLNPIEFSFSKIKSFVRAQTAHTVSTLIQNIVNGINELTESDLSGMFEKSRSYLRRCLNKEEILY